MDKNIIRAKLTPVFIRQEVIKAILFGSYARGKNTKKSDIDIMVVKNTFKRFFDRYDQFSDIFEIFKGYDVDLLIYNPDELEKMAGRKFIKRIFEEGELIYESGES